MSAAYDPRRGNRLVGLVAVGALAAVAGTGVAGGVAAALHNVSGSASVSDDQTSGSSSSRSNWNPSSGSPSSGQGGSAHSTTGGS